MKKVKEGIFEWQNVPDNMHFIIMPKGYGKIYYEKLKGENRMSKIYLLLYNKETHYQFFKYFDTIKEKDKFKRKIKYSEKIFIIEDSEDLNYIGNEVKYE